MVTIYTKKEKTFNTKKEKTFIAGEDINMGSVCYVTDSINNEMKIVPTIYMCSHVDHARRKTYLVVNHVLKGEKLLFKSIDSQYILVGEKIEKPESEIEAVLGELVDGVSNLVDGFNKLKELLNNNK